MPVAHDAQYYAALLEFIENDDSIELTESQREKLQTRANSPTFKSAAHKMGLTRNSVLATCKMLAEKAAVRGFAPDLPHVKNTLPGFSTKRITSHTSKDGSVSGWHIQVRDEKLVQEMLEDYARGLAESTIEPFPRKPALANSIRKGLDENLLSMIPIGDGHFGMYAWGEETGGEDFDTEIASRDLREAARSLIDKAPPAKTLVIVNVGDFLHMNSTLNTTLKGTQLDVDTRMPRVMKIAAMTLRYMVDIALERFETVYLYNARGNHDDNPAIGIALMLGFAYENNPRVIVPEAKGYFHYLEWGKWLWGMTHGDKANHRMLGDIMARDQKEAWGRTDFHWWMTGHFHKDHVFTLDNGAKVKICNPLVPPDGWHASMGYGGEQSMELITFRREGGIHSTYHHHIMRPKQAPLELLHVA